MIVLHICSYIWIFILPLRRIRNNCERGVRYPLYAYQCRNREKCIFCWDIRLILAKNTLTSPIGQRCVLNFLSSAGPTDSRNDQQINKVTHRDMCSDKKGLFWLSITFIQGYHQLEKGLFSLVGYDWWWWQWWQWQWHFAISRTRDERNDHQINKVPQRDTCNN